MLLQSLVFPMTNAYLLPKTASYFPEIKQVCTWYPKFLTEAHSRIDAISVTGLVYSAAAKNGGICIDTGVL